MGKNFKHSVKTSGLMPGPNRVSKKTQQNILIFKLNAPKLYKYLILVILKD